MVPGRRGLQGWGLVGTHTLTYTQSHTASHTCKHLQIQIHTYKHAILHSVTHRHLETQRKPAVTNTQGSQINTLTFPLALTRWKAPLLLFL